MLDLSRPAAPAAAPATVDGKFLAAGDQRLRLRGVTYGTFASGPDGLFPPAGQVARDFAAMAAAGIDTVRTYTVPGPRLLNLAAEHGLRLLIGTWWGDPRCLHPPSTAAWRQLATAAPRTVAAAVEGCAGHPAVLGFLVGNELPAPVVRWHGRRRIERLLDSLREAAKERAPEALVGYASFPTTAYLDTSGFDFDAFNVFLEDEQAFRRYLAQLQVERPDRPLLLTELGLDSGTHGLARQAQVCDWQLRVAVEAGVAGTFVFSWTDDWVVAGRRVHDWHFGLTTAAREPKPALAAVRARYHQQLLDLRPRWPRASAVVCAYQEEATIGRCLESLLALRYPTYEVIVVDDGSTDATARIARRFPVRLVSQEQRGLGAARNAGLAAATGQVVAYLDADAAADPDWLTYLVLGLDGGGDGGPGTVAVGGDGGPGTVAVGGPNLPPPDDPPVAQCIGRAPGGPAAVLLDDERAEHVPGCNMAFWRAALEAAGGFDPLYRRAGDDVDVCWRLLARGGRIGYAPAAVVWHHPRARVSDFWRQQVGYGRAEALVARRHPDRVDAAGRARWRGVVYGPLPLLPRRGAVYAGALGLAGFQRLYGQRGGVPLVACLAALAAAAPLGLADPRWAALPLAGAAALLAVLGRRGVREARRAGLRRAWAGGLLVAGLHLLQPLAREYGRLRWRRLAFPGPAEVPATGVLQRVGRRRWAAQPVDEAQRPPFVTAVRDRLRSARLAAATASAWDDADVVCPSAWWQAGLVTYAADGVCYVRLRCRPRRPAPAALLGGAGVLLAAAGSGLLWPAAVTCVAAWLGDGWRLDRRVRRALAG